MDARTSPQPLPRGRGVGAPLAKLLATVLSLTLLQALAPPARGQAIGPASPRARIAAPLLTAPAAEPTKQWRYDAAATVELAATDNALVTENDRKADLVATGIAALGVTGEGRRTRLNADIELAYDAYATQEHLDGLRAKALALGSLGLWADRFQLEGRAATDLREISQSGQTPTRPRSLGLNQTQVLNYGLTPTVRTDFDRSLVLEVAYDLSGVSFLAPPGRSEAVVAAGDSIVHRGNASLSSFSEANRLNWRLLASHESTHVSGGLPVADRQQGEASMQFQVLSRAFLIAAGGYDRIREPTLAEDLDSSFGSAGVLWQPSPRTNLRFVAGYRYRGFNASVDAFYRPSDRLALTASYARSIETPQRLLAGSLGSFLRDGAGNVVDPQTGLTPDTNPPAFDLNNQAFRRDLARVSANGRVNRNTYNLTGAFERRDANGAISRSWSSAATVGRQVSRRMSLEVTGAYRNLSGRQGPGGADSRSETTTLVGAIDYNLGEAVTASLSYHYQHRISAQLKYIEQVAVLSLRKNW